jgi:hypothetical protein
VGYHTSRTVANRPGYNLRRGFAGIAMEPPPGPIRCGCHCAAINAVQIAFRFSALILRRAEFEQEEQ